MFAVVIKPISVFSQRRRRHSYIDISSLSRNACLYSRYGLALGYTQKGHHNGRILLKGQLLRCWWDCWFRGNHNVYDGLSYEEASAHATIYDDCYAVCVLCMWQFMVKLIKLKVYIYVIEGLKAVWDERAFEKVYIWPPNRRRYAHLLFYYLLVTSYPKIIRELIESAEHTYSMVIVRVSSTLQVLIN